MTWWETVLASGIGGVIAGGFALAGVGLAHRLSAKSQSVKESRARKAVMQALLDEIETLWDRYTDTLGNQIETLPDGQPFLYYYPVFQDYFP